MGSAPVDLLGTVSLEFKSVRSRRPSKFADKHSTVTTSNRVSKHTFPCKNSCGGNCLRSDKNAGVELGCGSIKSLKRFFAGTK